MQALQEWEAGVRLTEKSNKKFFWQVHHQLYVTGREWTDFQITAEGFKPMIQRIYRDPAVIARIDQKLNEVIPEIEQTMEVFKKYML